MTKGTSAYLASYRRLNPEQREAVDTVEGPVLVLAGPGTGKTQLLSTRVGRILEVTDSSPDNILCLTFSDAAAITMRQRLHDLIGPAAYDITVETYHSFGNTLIRHYPELFKNAYGTEVADELTRFKIIRSICDNLDYDNPLKADYFTKNLMNLISDYKSAMMTPEILKTIADNNQEFILAANRLVSQHLPDNGRISKKQLPNYLELLSDSQQLPDKAPQTITPLKTLWLEQLNLAVIQSQETGKTAPLSKWKSQWLEHNKQRQFVLKGTKALNQQRAAAEIFQAYNDQMNAQNLIDYDDMILNAIAGLKTNPELLYGIQEQYQYLLLDEFQDTNSAQLELVELILNNPINEGRPNILAVGDDNQSVYSFQGAHYSQMERFYNNYRDTKLIKLVTNYRSTAEIVAISNNIRNQIQDGLAINDAEAIAQPTKLKSTIIRAELPQKEQQLIWTANQIANLSKQGIPLEEMVVLAPKHKYLREFIPYLHAHDIPATYQLKDNILDDPTIDSLLTMAQLVKNLHDNPSVADELWSKVLSYEFWQLPTSLIWQIHWTKHSSITEYILSQPATRNIALFFIRLSQIAASAPAHNSLNYLVGVEPLAIHEPDLQTYTSPFLNHYLSNLKQQHSTVSISEWRLFSRLEILTSLLPDNVNLCDMVDMIEDYRKAEIIINDHTTYNESNKAITLTTAFDAKGKEFTAVILLDVCDEVWGVTARNNNPSISLPVNLKHLRHSESTDDKLRLLFVAISRAKTTLILPSYAARDNKTVERLRNLQEIDTPTGLISPLLPDANQKVLRPKLDITTMPRHEMPWYHRHLQFTPELKQLLKDRQNDKLHLSATLLNDYTDVANGGPQQCYLKNILNFRSAQTSSQIYGIVMHDTLNWHFQQTVDDHQPTQQDIQDRFSNTLHKYNLTDSDKQLLNKRGIKALESFFLQTDLVNHPNDLSEFSLVGENPDLSNIILSGKIDRLIVDSKQRTLKIIDFKTGRPYTKWGSKIQAYHSERQLYFYYLLLKSSQRFKNYTIEEAVLYFLEPDEHGTITQLKLAFNEDKLTELEQLIRIVWNNIQQLHFPDTSTYSQNLSGIKKFESFLLKKITPL